MKYTICGFNQKKLVEYGLDSNDALILRWLIDFAATGKMKKMLENRVIYYQVIYDSIINEFPIMGLNNTKSISNRFDKYVKAGLLLKKRSGSNSGGSQTLFAITEVLSDMCYENSLSSPVDSATDHHSDEPSQNQKQKEITERNEHSSRNSSEAEKNNYSSREISDYSRKAERNEYSSRENKMNPERNGNSTRTEPPYHPNGMNIPLALNNPSTNSSLKNSSSSSEFSEKEELTKILGYYVDVKAFSDDFVEKLHRKISEFGLVKTDYRSYIDYAYEYCNDNVADKSKLMSYIYTSFGDNYLISKFLESKINAAKEKEAEKRMAESILIDCPVCGYRHSRYEFCPVCDLHNPTNVTEINFRKAVRELPADKKANLNKELDDLTLKFDVAKMSLQKQERENIYKKYIKIKHEDFIKIFG